jgi:hypothetical protein
VVNYDDSFSFLGFYIVRPDLRGRGYGLRTWRAAIARAGSRTIGLDGVVNQQDNYRKSGFTLAHRNIRFGGVTAAPSPSPSAPGLVNLADLPFAAVEADDATVFPAPRASFLRAWINAPGHRGHALIRDGRLAGWGVIRPCRTGHKIGPLVADDRPAAETVFGHLVRRSAAARCSSMSWSPTATRSHSPRRVGSNRCSRPRACTPAPSVR